MCWITVIDNLPPLLRSSMHKQLFDFGDQLRGFRRLVVDDGHALLIIGQLHTELIAAGIVRGDVPGRDLPVIAENDLFLYPVGIGQIKKTDAIKIVEQIDQGVTGNLQLGLYRILQIKAVATALNGDLEPARNTVAGMMQNGNSHLIQWIL